MDQAIARAVARRRSARYAARQRRRVARALVWVSAVLIGMASAAGFIWRSGWLRLASPDAALVPVEVAERAKAYVFLDEAVRARHENRAQGAINAITEARRLDPELPGIDFFVGEVAWENRDAETVRRAAAESLRRGHNIPGSKLLLALVKWSTRNVSDSATVGDSVREMLSEVTAESPSDPASFFFRGELSRLLGDVSAAHKELLGALYRQAPWTSALLIEIKMHLSAAEALRLARPAVVPPPEGAARAALASLELLDRAADDKRGFDNVISYATLLHAAFLLEDPAFAQWSSYQASSQFDRGLGAKTVPHGLLK